MEPEASLPCSQGPATGPYNEPDELSPNLLIHFAKIRSNIILPSTPRSPEWALLPFRFANQNVICISHFTQECYMSRTSYPSQFDHYICLSVKIMQNN
jgi:hypothetical protein